MRRIDILVSVLVVSLIVLGMFLGYGLGEENKPPEIKVKRQEEASVSSPIEPPEEQERDDEKAQDQNDKKTIKGGDNGVFKLGGSEIKLMLVQPQPLFSTELFSESEEEN